ELDRPRVLARLQHDGMAAQLEGAQLEAGAGAHGGIEEHQRDRAPLQFTAQLVALERGRLGEQRVQVRAAPVLGVEEVLERHRSIPCGGGRRTGMGWCLVRMKSLAPETFAVPETKKPSLGLGSRTDSTTLRSPSGKVGFRSARTRG